MDDDFIDLAEERIPTRGRMLRIEAFGTRLLLANVDGKLYAIADTCSHEDASLSLGALAGDSVKCPLHGSRFCLRTGAPLDEPAELPVACYPITRTGRGVRIHRHADS